VPDLIDVFDRLPGPMLLVRPDGPRFTVAAVTDDYLVATRQKREQVVGAPAPERLRDSFQRVLGTRARDLVRFEAAGRSWRAVDAALVDEAGAVSFIVHALEDLTEVSQLRELASAGEAQFRALFDSMPQLGWTARPDGYIDFYNRGWYEYTGTTFEEMQGWGWERVHDAELLPEVNRRWKQALASGTLFEMEFPLRRHDGTYRWFLTRARPLRNSEGKIVRWVGVNTDVHERRTQREAGEQRFARLIEAIRDYAVFLLDRTGHVMSWNPGAERIKGYRADEIIGRHLSIFYTPEEAQTGKAERELEVATRTGRFEEEGWRVRKDGSRFWASVILTAVRDERGELLGFAKVTRDLTERRRAEEERIQLVRSEVARAAAEAAGERFRFLAESSALLASTLDFEATVRNVAASVVPRFADWCVVELLEDEKLKTVTVVHVDPAKVAFARELQERWPGSPDSPTGAYHVLRTGQSELYETLSDELLRATVSDPDQLRVMHELQLRSAMVVPIQVRERTVGAISLIWAESNKQYTRDDVSLMEELGRRIGMAIESAQLYRESQDSVRLRDEFLSIASHELKTPLTTLQLQVSGLQRHAGKLADVPIPKVISRVETIDRQVQRLTGLINGLLDVSRATAGRLHLDLSEVDLGEVTRQAVDRLRDDLASAACTVTVETEKVVGHWDRLRLEQIVTNLTTNALKYGAGRPIEISARQTDGVAELSVRDHGIGISDADQQRIFGRFARAASAEHYGGLGLGLWIVQQFVEAMHGSISVESKVGEGARFTVKLPL
jgi:PAS domain S-box-containing protein